MLLGMSVIGPLVFSFLMAMSMMAENCLSRLSLKPTLPGLIRYLASDAAQAGCSFRSVWPL